VRSAAVAGLMPTTRQRLRFPDFGGLLDRV
jgi:hypothetical protein